MVSKEFSPQAFARSERGAGHIRTNRVLQDASACYRDERLAIIAVADGHGGERYVRSDRGARIACEVALELWQDVTSVDKKRKVLEGIGFEHFASCLIFNWRDRVETDLIVDPIETDDDPYALYGTTLSCVLVNREYAFMIQIGDGGIRILTRDGGITNPMPEDEACFLNETTSLCDKNALQHFRYARIPTRIIRTVFAFTDGLENSYSPKNLKEFLRRTSLMLHMDDKEAIQEIKTFLPRISEQGSGDDISLAAIY